MIITGMVDMPASGDYCRCSLRHCGSDTVGGYSQDP